jgi:hypothetical protein
MLILSNIRDPLSGYLLLDLGLPAHAELVLTGAASEWVSGIAIRILVRPRPPKRAESCRGDIGTFPLSCIAELARLRVRGCACACKRGQYTPWHFQTRKEMAGGGGR